MKCYCKHCLPRFFCQTRTRNDFCYYRRSIKVNGTHDYGCVQADVARFLCNTTDANYRTECCSTFFCNIKDRLVNGTITSPPTTRVQPNDLERHHPNRLNTIIVVGTLLALFLLVLIISCVYKRRFRSFRASSFKSNTITDDENSLPSHLKSNKASLLVPVDHHSDTHSWSSESFDPHNRMVVLETRRVNKEITFLGQLGQGRHARVRLGLIGRQYRAIKMYEPRFQNEFERELAIFQTDLIQHPNILAFFGADFFAKGTETCHMLIFEWHPYGTLHDVLKENKTEQVLTIDQLLQYAISLCDGLAHLHSIKYGTNGNNQPITEYRVVVRPSFEHSRHPCLFLDVCKPQMAHCDIKSSNILMKLNGECCLSDFSLAVRCHPHTKDIQGGGIERLYHRVGTKLYMPPELLDKNVTFSFDRISAYQQGDMYSLALVLWEIANCCCSITHVRPYENQLPGNFNVDHLVQLVCVEQKRPLSCIEASDPVLISFFNLLDFYWCQDPCARQSAANLQDQLRQLRPANATV